MTTESTDQSERNETLVENTADELLGASIYLYGVAQPKNGERQLVDANALLAAANYLSAASVALETLQRMGQTTFAAFIAGIASTEVSETEAKAKCRAIFRDAGKRAREREPAPSLDQCEPAE